MTREEAIKYAEAMKAKVQEKIEFFRLGHTHAPEVYYSDLAFLSTAISALREQEERESVWHDAQDTPPQKPGLYYGKMDDTDSMYLCQYRDGVWTLDAYPETRMHVIKWAYYNAFVQEQEERRWIPVTERLPEPGERVLATDGGFVGELYVNSRGQWQRYNVNDHSLLMALDILWWMPLPQPPKEE